MSVIPVKEFYVQLIFTRLGELKPFGRKLSGEIFSERIHSLILGKLDVD